MEQCPESDDDDSSFRPDGSLSDASDSTYFEEKDRVASYDKRSEDGSEMPSAMDATSSDKERTETKVISGWDRPTNECPCCDTFNPFELSGPYGTGKTVYAGYTCVCKCCSSWVVEKGYFQYDWSHTPFPVFVVGHHPKNAKEYCNVAPSQLWHPVFGPTVHRFDRLSGRKTL